MLKRCVSFGCGGFNGFYHLGAVMALREYPQYTRLPCIGSSSGALAVGVYRLPQVTVEACNEIQEFIASLRTGEAGLWTLNPTICDWYRDFYLRHGLEAEDLKAAYTVIGRWSGAEYETGWESVADFAFSIQVGMHIPFLNDWPQWYKGGLVLDGGLYAPTPLAPGFSREETLVISPYAERGADICPEGPETKTFYEFRMIPDLQRSKRLYDEGYRDAQRWLTLHG